MDREMQAMTKPAQNYQPSSQDERWIQHTLVLAEAAAAAGEVPVGAVIVCDGELIGEGV